MSSSSSDSDSDEFEPIQRIKINIRPRDESGPIGKGAAADVSQIKASVEAWRPLGPPTHPSLSRRQSSLSSVSSMSFGATGSAYGSPFGTSNFANGFDYPQTLMSNSTTTYEPFNSPGLLKPSPSCSSLVSECNNRSSFNNFAPTVPRNLSPLSLAAQADAIPIAIAIQETIELIVRGSSNYIDTQEPIFEYQALGNIKIAFPNSFARNCSTRIRTNPPLKLRMHFVDNIIKYYASRLIKDGLSELSDQPTDTTSAGALAFKESTEDDITKLIEFDMDKLNDHLKKLYDQSNLTRYYSVDFLRYQIKPISTIEQAPLQVCAYWKIEDDMVKLRINFKHSSNCGFSLERLRDITFTVDLSSFIPPNIELSTLSPDSISSVSLHNNNNVSSTMNMNKTYTHLSPQPIIIDQTETSVGGGNTQSSLDARFKPKSQITPLLPPPTTLGRQRGNGVSRGRSGRLDAAAMTRSRVQSNKQLTESSTAFRQEAQNTNIQRPQQTLDLADDLLSDSQKTIGSSHDQTLKISPLNPINGDKMSPFVASEPRGTWNSSIKQLTWRLETLLAYRKSEGAGTLLAKVDFRNDNNLPARFLKSCKPAPVNIKYFITDSTLSKMNLNLESTGYRVSILKKEIRSGRYKSEPYIVT